mgnify:CR=1 FL=1
MVVDFCFIFFDDKSQLEEGKKLVRDAIASGIFNDLGSGSNVDLCVITRHEAQYLRPYDEANVKGKRYFLIILSH